jgi:hypothetical protein
VEEKVGVKWKRPSATYELTKAYDTDKMELLYSILFAKDMGMDLFRLTKICLKKPIIRTT